MTRGSEERWEFTVTGTLMSEAANHEGGGRAIASETLDPPAKRSYCALVHAGLGFEKRFIVQKFVPQLAFLSIASSVPLPDASMPNTWFPPLPLSMPIPATVLVSAVVVGGTA
jgi:hypothetical protein